MDRAYGGFVMVNNSVGGMKIEKVAEEHPDQIHTVSDKYLVIERFFILHHMVFE